VPQSAKEPFVKKERRIRSILFAGILVLVGLLAAKYHFRIDLTSDRAYTVSGYTTSCLTGLDANVFVTWYRSPSLARLFPSIANIEDMLEEYRVASDGRLSWKTVSASSSDSSTLRSLGIIPRQIKLSGSEGSETRDVFSGLVVEYKGGRKAIPFLFDSKKIEYDLTRTIVELKAASAGGQQRIQLVYGTSPDRYAYIRPWLEYAGFSVDDVTLPVTSFDVSIPLLVVGSQLIDAQTAGAMDEFLSAGGNAVFFVSGTSVNIAENWKALPKEHDAILELLQGRGISIRRELILDTSNFRMTMPSLDNSTYESINYPFWVTVQPSENKDILLSGISALQFFWPSPISIDSAAQKRFHEIAHSSEKSIVMMEPFDTNPFGKQDALFSTRAVSSKSVCVSGNSPGRIVVVPDEYFPSAMIDYTASDANLDFMVNCAEWVSGKDRLIELKNKTGDTVAQPPSDQMLAVARAINLLLIPSIIVICALTIFIVRRKKR
jgi:ABC-type uncharacterized transport system involved in gliding motility auxiliary subunit